MTQKCTFNKPDTKLVIDKSGPVIPYSFDEELVRRSMNLLSARQNSEQFCCGFLVELGCKIRFSRPSSLLSFCPFVLLSFCPFVPHTADCITKLAVESAEARYTLAIFVFVVNAGGSQVLSF
jgi:hypothetical protein